MNGKQDSFLIDVEWMFNRQAESVRSFQELYHNYVANRQVLKTLLITAIEKGEMGSEFQEAVVSIYGPASKGDKPKIGTKSLYLELEQNSGEISPVRIPYL